MAFTGSCIIWVDPEANIFALVSEEDYEWAQQWRWHITLNSRKKKMYVTRCSRRPKSRRQIKIYMHKEILKRTGIMPPTKKHTIGDHRNGDSLDCRRENLRWATQSMNRTNRRAPELPEVEQEIPF